VAKKRTALSDDALLRSRGFAIHARPKKGPALWVRHRKVLWESAALDIARREQEADDKLMREMGQ